MVDNLLVVLFLDPKPLRASVQGMRHVDGWLAQHAAGRKPIVITLRHYGYGTARNSDLSAWMEFVSGLDRSLYAPVVVPDTEGALAAAPEFGGAPVFTAAAWSLGLRMALYERAYLNLMVNTGPHLLCMFNERCRYLMFKVLTPSVRQTSEAYMRFLGFEIGAQPPFASPVQRWVWEDDRPEVIAREFMAMCRTIETLDVGRSPYQHQ